MCVYKYLYVDVYTLWNSIMKVYRVFLVNTLNISLSAWLFSTRSFPYDFVHHSFTSAKSFVKERCSIYNFGFLLFFTFTNKASIWRTSAISVRQISGSGTQVFVCCTAQVFCLIKERCGIPCNKEKQYNRKRVILFYDYKIMPWFEKNSNFMKLHAILYDKL